MVLEKLLTKKKLIIILALIELCTLFLVSKSLSNKSYALDDVNILNQKFEDGNMFAMFVDYGDGEYMELENVTTFPSSDEYSLNSSMSACLNGNGDVINVEIEYENDTVTIKTKRKLFCYLYFELIDNSLSLFEAFKNSSLITEYRGPGYYHDENDRDTNQPFFTTPIYYWNGSVSNNITPIRNKWNVLFANSCWQMIRTTENNGVKLLYNGEPNINENLETGGISYDCSSNRTNYNISVGTVTTLSLNGNYYYANGYSWNRDTRLFVLDGADDNPIVLDATNYQSVIGRFTCRSTAFDGTCSTLYYIDEYVSGSSVKAIPISTISYRDSIGYGKYNSESELPTYAFGDGFEIQGKTISNSYTMIYNQLSHTDRINMKHQCKYSSCFGVNYYYSDSYSMDNSTNSYFLSGNVTLASKNSNGDYSDLVGKYTLLSTDASKKEFIVYYVVGIQGTEMYYAPAASHGEVLIPSQTFYSITPENDQIVVQSRAVAGIRVPVVSNVSGYEVASFRVNGVTINGMDFEMPSQNVVITDVKFIPMITVESIHYDNDGYIYGLRNYYENTFEGATSINVELGYYTPSPTAISEIIIYKNDSSTVFNRYTGVTYQVTNIDNVYMVPTANSISVPGNYIKIDYKFPSAANYRPVNYYGFKAKITPIYGNSATEPEPVTLTQSGDGSGDLEGYLISGVKYARVAPSVIDNGNGTYTLNNYVYINWIQENKNYNNYYFCPDNKITCRYEELKLVSSADISWIYYYQLRTPEPSITISSTYSKNNDIYTLTNPVTIPLFNSSSPNWVDNYSNYQGYYVCANKVDSSCTDIKHIFGVSRTSYSYFDNISFSNAIDYTNGEYHLNSQNLISTLDPEFLTTNNYRYRHYTCFNGSGVCSKMNFIYYAGSDKSSAHFYVTMENGKYVSTNINNNEEFENNNNVFYNIFHTNPVDSSKKIIVDNWYKVKINSVENYNEYVDREEIFCNNRNVSGYAGWAHTNSFVQSRMSFSKNENDLSCQIYNDALSADETTHGNGDLTYPVAFLNYAEENLLSSPYLRQSSMNYHILGDLKFFARSNDYYNENYYINSSGSFSSGDLYGTNISLRPSIALKSTASYLEGNGSDTNPYVVIIGNIVVINDQNYKVLQNRVVSGQRVKIYLSNQDNTRYEVISFKLNGVTINGNVFTMPNAIAKITDIESAQVVYDINSLDNDVILPEYARVGDTVTLLNDNYYIESFKLNGTLITGNTFTMPSNDVTITDVEKTAYIIVESEHNPYANSINNVVYYENTFEGATSITVELTYQTEGTSWDWVYLYQDASTIYNNQKYGGQTQTTTTITIPTNYLKIVFKTDGGGNNYYGFKAKIAPNYS